ncbi:MAG TPA: hypothetical protein EYQ24_06250 [Bacteroidetes bacterium]|nr:hypothetical protein [Bacteroidota bacterium]
MQRARGRLHAAHEGLVPVPLAGQFEEPEEPVVVEEQADAPIAPVQSVPEVGLGEGELLVHHVRRAQLLQKRQDVSEVRDHRHAAVGRPVRVDGDHEQSVLAAVCRPEPVDRLLDPGGTLGERNRSDGGH